MESPAQPKVDFVLGSEVSPSHFFKSSYARSIAETSGRDSKSLDYDFLDNGTIAEENSNDGNNNFYSLVNFASETGGQPSSSIWNSGAQQQQQQQQQQPSPLDATTVYQGNTGERSAATPNQSELEKLRKRCQMLTMENERLRSCLRNQQSNQGSAQVIDTIYLQNQVDTLQWQLKQSEASREMYRSTMEQVARFLDRSRKSLAILSEKSATIKKTAVKEKIRVPRSRSVHAVHGEHGSAGGSAGSSASFASSSISTSSSNSSSSASSRFGRAKSVAQISGNVSGDRSSTGSSFKDFTWSVLRRNAEPPKAKPPPPPPPPPLQSANAQEISGSATQETAAYRRPKQTELDPDEVPPEKLAQEAFRLMRTVQSVLVMREPDLARVSAAQDVSISSSPIEHLDMSTLSLHRNFVNSTALQESGSSSSDRGTEGSGSCYTDDETNRTVYSGDGKVTVASDSASSEQTLMSPGARQSLDATSLNSASSKNTEDEERNLGVSSKQDGQSHGNGYGFAAASVSSMPIGKRIRKIDRKDHLKSLKDWALGSSSGSVTSRPKPATSVSSAEDESGFSSMSSFQEVGLPHVANVPPVKGGCHTEVGLPEVPIEKMRHRRWSSTPAEFQALFKRHSGSFATSGQTSETVSVWV